MAFLPFGALESIRDDLGLTYVQGGVLLALYPGIGILATPFGVLADRMSRRAMAALGALGYGAGLLLFAAAGQFWTLVVAIALMGFAGDAMVTAAEVALVDVAGDRVEPALARSNLLASIGDLVGPALLAASLAAGLGWRPPFLVAGAGVVLYGLVLATQRLPKPHPHPDGHTLWRTFLAVVRDRRVLRAGMLVAVVDAFDETFLGFAIAFLTVARGLNPAVAVLAGGSAVAGGIAATTWASRTNRRRIGLRLPSLGLVVGVIVLLVAPHAIVAAVAAAVVGAAMNLAWVILQARFMTLRPGEAGTTSSVVGAIGQVAVAVPLVIGFVADHRGLAPAMGIYLLISVAFLVANRRD